MARFTQIKSVKSRLKQDQLAKELGCSTSILQVNRNDINMISAYSIPPNKTNRRRQKISNTIFDNNSHSEHDLKRPQLTSNNFKRPQLISKDANEKNKPVSKKADQKIV